MEIAGTSDAVWLFMLEICERPSEKIIDRKTLALYGWAMHERFLFHALNGESASESHDEEYRGKIAHDRQAFPKRSQMPNRFSERAPRLN